MMKPRFRMGVKRDDDQRNNDLNFKPESFVRKQKRMDDQLHRSFALNIPRFAWSFSVSDRFSQWLIFIVIYCKLYLRSVFICRKGEVLDEKERFIIHSGDRDVYHRRIGDGFLVHHFGCGTGECFFRDLSDHRAGALYLCGTVGDQGFENGGRS